MVLTNFYKYLYIIGANVESQYITGLDGQSSYVRPDSAEYNQRFLNFIGAVVGSGTTTPTAADTDLSDRITTLSDVVATVNKTFDADGLKRIVTITGTNNTGAAVSISEVGLTMGIFDANGNLTNTCLVTHDLLDAALTVPDGQGFSITVSWLES